MTEFLCLWEVKFESFAITFLFISAVRAPGFHCTMQYCQCYPNVRSHARLRDSVRTKNWR